GIDAGRVVAGGALDLLNISPVRRDTRGWNPAPAWAVRQRSPTHADNLTPAECGTPSRCRQCGAERAAAWHHRRRAVAQATLLHGARSSCRTGGPRSVNLQ